MKKFVAAFAIFFPLFVAAQQNDSPAKVLDSLMKNPPAKTSLTFAVATVDSAAAAIPLYTVQRDTTAEITVSHDSIIQDGKIIGYFHEAPGYREVLLPGGQLVTRFTVSDEKCMLYTAIDRKQRDFLRAGFYRQQIAEVLVSNGYL